MPAKTKDPVTTAPIMLCAYWMSAHGFVSSPQKLDTLYPPLGSRTYATGCCIQASVTMMKKPDSHDPRKTRKPAHQCPHRPSRFSPYRKRPRNADSRKKQNVPSMASGCPMTPAVSFAERAQ